MIADQLYALAFEYKKTKLWNVLWDMDVFAVKLSDGNIGYISIMGGMGEHCALGLYIGDAGFQSFRALAQADELSMAPLEFHENILQQDCLQCAFEPKDELTDEEREGVKQYARAHGIRVAGKNAYPRFVKYQPYCYPWELQDEKDQMYLCEALTAVIALSKLLANKSPDEMGLRAINEKTETVVMLEMRDGACTLGTTELPKPVEVQIPEPKTVNEVSLAKLKKMKRSGVWECEIVCCPQPVRDQEGQVPYFPLMVMAVDQDTGYLLPVLPVPQYEKNPEQLLNGLLEAFLAYKVCPMEIWVRDERTRAFAKEFCGRLGIPLRMQEELDALEEAEYAFLEEISIGELGQMEDVVDMLESILKMDDELFNSMPDEIAEQIRSMAEQGMLPKELKQRLEERMNALPPEPEHSYVISVSPVTGCYRHIQISGSSTLKTLHDAIQDAFEFDDDHPHAFFMDNRVWSDRNCYFVKGAEGGGRTTDKYTLNQVGLSKGMQFKYLFDFGDEWVFQCKVLRIVEGSVAEPSVIRSRGEAPPQYDDWDDGWDDEEDDEDQ